jgi:hypothetical protein
MRMMLTISLFGQLDDDDDENKPLWPAWAVSVLSDTRDMVTNNRGHPSQRSLRGSKLIIIHYYRSEEVQI